MRQWLMEVLLSASMFVEDVYTRLRKLLRIDK